MDESTHPAAETITLFAPEASPTGTATAEQQGVEELAARLGLDRTRLSALHAVMAWAAFLRPSTDARERDRLRTYLDVMGYLPADRKVVANAERSRATIDAAVPGLLEGFARGELDPETFLEADTEQQLLPAPPGRAGLGVGGAGLTRSQLALLKSILR